MKNTETLILEKYFEYKKFVEECREKKYDNNLILHKHHILPKNLGGTDENNNLISVSVEDHIKLHLLLSECFSDDSKEQIDNLRSARVLNKKSIREKDVLQKISRSYVGANNPFYGKKHSKETIQKLIGSSKKRKGIDYDSFYKDRAIEEKKKRSDATKKQWQNMDVNRAKEIRSKISKTIKENGSMRGGNNPFAQKVEIEGIFFESISEACVHFNVSKYILKKKFNIRKIQ